MTDSIQMADVSQLRTIQWLLVFFFLIEIQLIYNIILVSGVHNSHSKFI